MQLQPSQSSGFPARRRSHRCERWLRAAFDDFGVHLLVVDYNLEGEHQQAYNNCRIERHIEGAEGVDARRGHIGCAAVLLVIPRDGVMKPVMLFDEERPIASCRARVNLDRVDGPVTPLPFFSYRSGC